MGILVFCNTKLNSAITSLIPCCSVKSNSKENSRSCEYPFPTNPLCKGFALGGRALGTLQNIHAVKSQHVLVTKGPIEKFSQMPRYHSRHPQFILCLKIGKSSNSSEGSWKGKWFFFYFSIYFWERVGEGEWGMGPGDGNSVSALSRSVAP